MKFDTDTEDASYEKDVSEITEVSVEQSTTAELIQGDNDLLPLQLREDLKMWYIQHKVSHLAVNSLLQILNEHFPSCVLPNDARTLLGTKRERIDLQPMNEGHYWHNGLKKSLQMCLKTECLLQKISLIFNIDGLPIHKSSKYQFWPILCRIYECVDMPPFIVGIYGGYKKPSDLNIYLGKFMEEMKELIENGLEVTHLNIKKIINVKIRCFVCDAPARAFIKGVCNFNGKHGCMKCNVIGEYSHLSHTVTFRSIGSLKRNDEDFRLKKYGSHHKYDSPLLQLPIDMVEDFPVSDSLHLVDLGIVKRLLIGWRDGNFKTYVTKWRYDDINKVSNFLKDCKVPSEIHRTVRGLEDLLYWKGTEFRTFFYYLSIIILKYHLNENAYHHYLCLFCAITICSSEKYFHFLPLAEKLLSHFVSNFKYHYGEDYMTSNVHNLLHLVDEVRRFGKLQDFNAYPFENKLFAIKQLLRQGNSPLTQAAKRLLENEANEFKNMESKNKNPYVKYLKGKEQPVCVLHMDDFVLSKQEKNKWFLSAKNEVVEIEQIIEVNNNTFEIHGSSIHTKHDVFINPVKSSYLNIYKAAINARKIGSVWNVSEVKCKFVSTSYKDEIYFLPLLHTISK